jgi:hypothetical protein
MKAQVLVDMILDILPDFSITAIYFNQGGSVSKTEYYVN